MPVVVSVAAVVALAQTAVVALLQMTDDCTLGIPFDQLVADGQYSNVWPDAYDLEEPEGTLHGQFAAFNQS